MLRRFRTPAPLQFADIRANGGRLGEQSERPESRMATFGSPRQVFRRCVRWKRSGNEFTIREIIGHDNSMDCLISAGTEKRPRLPFALIGLLNRRAFRRNHANASPGIGPG